jgi:carboxymethylenebutenolidase
MVFTIELDRILKLQKPHRTDEYIAIVQSAKAFEEKLKKAAVPSEVYMYPNVAHAFMNASPEAIERKKETGFGDHHQEAVDLAWSRFEAWFGKYLKA